MEDELMNECQYSQSMIVRICKETESTPGLEIRQPVYTRINQQKNVMFMLYTCRMMSLNTDHQHDCQIREIGPWGIKIYAGMYN